MSTVRMSLSDHVVADVDAAWSERDLVLAAIEASTPDWVRQCRGKDHFVLLTIRPGKFSWQCTTCGKDCR